MSNWWPTSHYPTISEDFAYFLFDIGTRVQVNLGQIIFESIAGYGNRKKKGQKLPYHSLIYGVLAAQKELKFDSEFLTRRKPLVIYMLVEKGKSKGEKFTSTYRDVTTCALAPPTDVTKGPAITALTKEVQDLKAQLAKHGDTLGFIEKVSLDLWSKFNVVFPATVAPHQIGVTTPVPGNVATSAATVQSANS